MEGRSPNGTRHKRYTRPVEVRGLVNIREINKVDFTSRECPQYQMRGATDVLPLPVIQ